MKNEPKRTRPKPPPRPDEDDRPSVPVRYRHVKPGGPAGSGTFVSKKWAVKKAAKKKAQRKTSKSKKGTRARSAITGRYVKKSFAKKHPRTTVVERVKRNLKKRSLTKRSLKKRKR